MYITCQECNTTFRLDDSLLKPSGSKVRCSQCGNIFIAVPPPKVEPVPVVQATAVPPDQEAPFTQATRPESVTMESSSAAAESVDQAVEGIDIAELDAFFKEEQSAEAVEPPPTEKDISADLDDIDFDIDFDAALETGLADDELAPDAAAAEPGDDLFEDLDLELDFDLIGDDETAMAENPPPVDEIADQAPPTSGEAVSMPQDMEDHSAAADFNVDGMPENDLELALEDVELEAEADATVFADIPAIDEAPGEEELGLDLDDDATVFAPTEDLAANEDLSELELDLEQDLDLEDVLDDSKKPDAESAPKDQEAIGLDLKEDLELELDLENESPPQADLDIDSAFEPEAPAAGDIPKDMEGDDLILSDLDNILAEATLAPDDEATEAPEKEVELELDLETDAQADRTVVLDQEEEEELEELAFELDAEFEDKPISQTEVATAPAASGDDEDEIDLSDIEQMLGDDKSSADSPPVAKAFDADFEAEATLFADDDQSGVDAEIDLTELEAAIDSVDTEFANETATIAEEDLELSLAPDMDADENGSDLDGELEIDLDELELDQLEDAEPPPATASEVDGLDLELEMVGETTAEGKIAESASKDDDLDLSDLDDLMLESAATAAKPDIVDAGDIELEFQIEDEPTAPQVQEHLDTMTPESAPAIDETFSMPTQAEMEEEKPKPTKPKKKSSKLLLVIFILVLLGAIGYGLYYAVTVLNIEIPYISAYLKPAPQDTAGIAKLSTLDISSKFIENQNGGRLFVITGKVHNAYTKPRINVRVQGKLFTKGKILSQTEYVYAGVMISDNDLTSMTSADIKQRLSTPPKDVQVLPNQNIQFIVVFSELPSTEDLDEFAIEPVGSMAVQ